MPTPVVLSPRSTEGEHSSTVTFDLNGALGFTPPIGVWSGDSATAPALVPRVAGHTFLGWFTAATGGTRWDFARPVTGALTFYARWAQHTSVQLVLGPDAATLASGTIVAVTGCVSPATARGVIELFDGPVSLGRDLVPGEPCSIEAGTVSVDAIVLRAGEHHFRAIFTPLDGSFLGSSSPAHTVFVNRRLPQGIAPAADTAQLLQLAVGNAWPTVQGGATLPWADPADSFVDVFLYEAPVALGPGARRTLPLRTLPLGTLPLGTLPLGSLSVTAGFVQRTQLKLPVGVPAAYYLAFVGQTSGAVALAAHAPAPNDELYV